MKPNFHSFTILVLSSLHVITVLILALFSRLVTYHHKQLGSPFHVVCHPGGYHPALYTNRWNRYTASSQSYPHCHNPHKYHLK